MAELFGFSITRVKKPLDPKQAFTQPQADDGTSMQNPSINKNRIKFF